MNLTGLLSAAFETLVSVAEHAWSLLGRVQAEHPDVVRIVLSGYAELDAALRAVPVAHQFLTKPCDPELLENVIERACALQELIGDQRVRSVVGKIDKLPSLPRLYSALTRALTNPSADAATAAAILQQDVAMVAKLLQLVNSAFFGLRQRVTSVDQAVAYLGFNMIKTRAC